MATRARPKPPPVVDTKKLAQSGDKIDFVNLQMFLYARDFIQKMKESLKKAIAEEALDKETAEKRMREILKHIGVQPSNLYKSFDPNANYYEMYKNIMWLPPEMPPKLKEAWVQNRFTVDDIAPKALTILKEIDKIRNPKKASHSAGTTMEHEHKDLLARMTIRPGSGRSLFGVFTRDRTSNSQSVLPVDPNSGFSKFKGVVGGDFFGTYEPTVAAGRIPYSFGLRGSNKGRPQQLSLGNPVVQRGGMFRTVLSGITAIAISPFVPIVSVLVAPYFGNPIKTTTAVLSSLVSSQWGAGRLATGVKKEFKDFVKSVCAKPTGPRSRSREAPKKGKFNYVYINLQKKHACGRSNLFEVSAEAVRSRALESEINAIDGAACITLPADNPFFMQGYDKEEGAPKKGMESHKKPASSLLSEVSESIAEQDGDNDFYFPPKVKKALFGKENPSKEEVEEKLKTLFQDSLASVAGTRKLDQELGTEERSALMTDFVKGKLTAFIMKELDPDKYNITCKDAIDRAGIHNLFYTIERQIDKKASGSDVEPLTIEELNNYLDASAMGYKARPANGHRNIILNAMVKKFEAAKAIAEYGPEQLEERGLTEKDVAMAQSVVTVLAEVPKWQQQQSGVQTPPTASPDKTPEPDLETVKPARKRRNAIASRMEGVTADYTLQRADVAAKQGADSVEFSSTASTADRPTLAEEARDEVELKEDEVRPAESTLEEDEPDNRDRPRSPRSR